MTTRDRHLRLVRRAAWVVTVLALAVSLTAGARATTPAPPAPAATAPGSGFTGPAVAQRTAAAAAASSATRGRAPSGSSFTAFTLNVAHDLGARKALADLRRALTLGDAGGLQELSDERDRDALRRLTRKRGWGRYLPTGGGGAVPVVFDRSRFRLVSGRTVKVHGAEPGVTPSRYVNVVRLRERDTGRVFGLVNTHVIPGASRGAELTDWHRIPRLRKHLRVLRREIRTLFGVTENVFVSGDLNVNYLADRRRRNKGLPTDALGDLVSFDMPRTRTFGRGSLLDYAMSVKRGSGLVPVRSRVVRGFHSDHDAVVVTYRTRDLLAAGPLHNRLGGTTSARTRVRDRLVRAVANAERGAVVRLATPRLTDPALARALSAALSEGVRVRLVVGARPRTAAAKRLRAALGPRGSGASWSTRCRASCLGGPGRLDAGILLVDRAGATTRLAAVGPTVGTRAAGRRQVGVLRTTGASTYRGLRRLFTRLAADRRDPVERRVLRWGRTTAHLYPVGRAPRRDPVLRALAPVRCRDADGLRTRDGRTNVRVVVRGWSGDRGRRIASRLQVLRRRGCDVAALLGPRVSDGVRRHLARASVRTRRAPVGDTLLVVDGGYGRRGNTHTAFVGGPAWTKRARGNDAVTLVVRRADHVRRYLASFRQAWRRAT